MHSIICEAIAHNYKLTNVLSEVERTLGSISEGFRLKMYVYVRIKDLSLSLKVPYKCENLKYCLTAGSECW